MARFCMNLNKITVWEIFEMNKNFYQLYDILQNSFKKILTNKENSIDRATDLIVQSIKKDQLVHIFGTGGHSSMGATEMFWRVGCLAAMNPLLDPSILPSMGAKHSNWMERTEGLVPSILNAYNWLFDFIYTAKIKKIIRSTDLIKEKNTKYEGEKFQ